MILLTFNLINIFASLKHNREISEVERTEITQKNTNSLLRILELHDIKATFFVEIALTEKLKPLLKKIIEKGHEISFYNRNSTLKEIEEAKFSIQNFIEKNIRGIRQKEISYTVPELKSLEFNYISNIENANILFPFKRLQRSTEISEEAGMNIVPESISPFSQLPYNDFVFQMLPQTYYQNMVVETLKAEDFVLIYLNSWQFTDFKKYPFQIPFYRKLNSGRKMEDKLEDFLKWINEKELATSRMKDYIF